MLIVASSAALTEIAFTLLALAAMVAIAHLVLARQRRLEPVPKHGSLSCNVCTALVAPDVRYVGQEVICPRCGTALRAPGAPPAPDLSSMKVIIALAVTIALVLLLLARV